jgi:hypothetical protein
MRMPSIAAAAVEAGVARHGRLVAAKVVVQVPTTGPVEVHLPNDAEVILISELLTTVAVKDDCPQTELVWLA